MAEEPENKTEGSEDQYNPESVLEDTKHYCGVPPMYHDFDGDICGAINTQLATLCQLGVILPSNLKYVQNATTTWSEFSIPEQALPMAKQYTKIKTRLAFDPPASGTIRQALEAQAAEIEWRAQFAVEYPVENPE